MPGEIRKVPAEMLDLSKMGAFSLRNKIINGDMIVKQRAWMGHRLGTTHNGGQSGLYGFDRWIVYTSTHASLNAECVPVWDDKFSPRTAFINFNNLGTNPAPSGVEDYVVIQHTLEGLNSANLGWGTPSAKPAVLSFTASSSVDGFVMSIAVRNAAWNKSFVASVALTTTPKRYEIAIPAIASGSWNVDNSGGVAVSFVLRKTSKYHTATLNQWQDGNFIAATAQTDLFTQAAGAKVSIGLVQFEEGIVATPFEYRPFGLELSLCQRYFYNASGECALVSSAPASYANASTFPTEMRTYPTVVCTPASGSGATMRATAKMFFQYGVHSGDSSINILTFSAEF